MSHEGLDNCFFFIANRISYFRQAAISALRITELMPNCPVIMFIAEPLDWGRNDLPKDYFRGRIKLSVDKEFDQPDCWFLTQNHLMSRALECLDMMGVQRAIYLDCDTYMIDPVYELFDLVDQFDLSGAHAPGRITAQTVYPIPPCFPEMNIGVNPMRVDPNTIAFWTEVASRHLTHLEVFGNNDQAPLRQSLYEVVRRGSNFRYYIFPPEYNLRFHFPFMVKGRVKILHGPQEHAVQVAELINKNQGDMRSWSKITESL